MNFNSYAEYQDYKSNNNICYVDGCDCFQTKDNVYCESHGKQENFLFKECSCCDIPVPFNIEYCKYHGGKNFTNVLSKKLKALYDADDISSIDIGENKKNSYFDKIKSDAVIGLKGAALSKFITNSKKIIMNSVQKLGMNSPMLLVVSEFLDTTLGEVLYKYGISLALDSVAHKTSKIDLEAIASDLRQQATKAISEDMLEMILPSIFGALGVMEDSELKSTSSEVKHEVKQIENLAQNRVVVSVPVEQTESVSV